MTTMEEGNKEEHYVFTLDKKYLKKATDELNEDPTQRDSHIASLRDWVATQPHIACRTDDHFLLRFLRAGKFSQLRAQEILENYCTVRSVEGKGAPDWYKDLDPLDKRTSEILDMGIQVPLPGLDDEGRRVILVQTGGYDPYQVTMEEMMRTGLVTQEVIMMDENTQVNGMVVALDFAEFSTYHVLGWSRDAIKKSSQCWNDTYPSRNKGMHYYKTPIIFNALFEIFAFFMKEKIRKRLCFHKDDLSSLQKHIPKRMLPTEYGGTAGTLKEITQSWKEIVIQNRDEILLNRKCCVDESKRPKVETVADGGWGIVGSFRKLAT